MKMAALLLNTVHASYNYILMVGTCETSSAGNGKRLKPGDIRNTDSVNLSQLLSPPAF